MNSFNLPNTRVNNHNGWCRVYLYNTNIIKFDDDEIVLNYENDKFKTPTTKNRLNQISKIYDLGFKVIQKKGSWYAEFKGFQVLFSRCVRLHRKGNAVYSLPSNINSNSFK